VCSSDLPAFEGQAAALLGAIDYPNDRKTQCYCDAEATARMAALEAAGFTREAVLPRQIARGDVWLDVIVYSRG
jgi:RimJ/RimL family protein N-acetyltransferase